MSVGALGEFALIDRIAALASDAQDRQVVLGIGDDAALLRPRRGHDVVVTTDAFVEGVHFRFADESARTAGRRAMVANLSDLAAMGAAPLGCTLALSTPPAARVADVLGLVRGLLAEAARAGCPLVGGNVTRGRDLSLAVTAIGQLRAGHALRRDAARPRDRVLVTGTLGRSALERRRGRVRTVPEPRLAIGRALARARWRGACIDVSDGLVRDLGHLARASGVLIRVDSDAVPRPRGFSQACAAAGADPDQLALEGGEDWELVFTTRPGAPRAAVLAARYGVAVTEIGRVFAGPPALQWEGAARPSADGGWRHF